MRAEFLALKHESNSSNSVCGYSMKEQVRLYAVWPFIEPDTGLDHCPRILLCALEQVPLNASTVRARCVWKQAPGITARSVGRMTHGESNRK